MELMYALVQLLVALCAVHASVVHPKGTEMAGEATGAIDEEQRKIHQECRNPDYKKYVMCLMRPKRHHHGHGETPDTDPIHCLEECLKKCSSDLHDCDKKCGHCTKKTKHRHQIVTEYEINCESGNCYGSAGDDHLRTTNITTNIDINNIINTHPINGTPGHGPSKPGTKPTRPGGDGTETGGGGESGEGGEGGKGGEGGEGGEGGKNGNGGPGKPGKPGIKPGPGTGIDIGVGFNETISSVAVPSIPLVPQISMVPQITYGINLASGCVFSTWLCIQQGATRAVQPSTPDCSVCGNPLLHHRCNVTFCYASTRVSGTACKSPACVGGST